MRDSLTADSTDIIFECSKCGQRMVVESSAAGVKTDCPACSTPLTVPEESKVVEESTVQSESPKVEPEATAPAPVLPPSPQEAEPKTIHQLEAALAEAYLEIERQHSLFKKAVDECERLNASSTHIQAEIKSFRADRQQLKADLAQARQAAATAEAQVSELTDTLSATQEESSALRYQAEVDINSLHERISGVEAQLAARETALQESKTEHTNVLRSLARTRAEYTKINTEATSLRSEVATLRTDLQAATEELTSTSQQLSDLKAHYDALVEEHQVATSERDDFRQQAEGFHHDLAELDNGRELLELRAQHAELQSKHDSLEAALAEQAEAAKKDTAVLRGIVDRQNATLGEHHVELRRLRRSRFSLRLVYAIFSLGLLALGYVAFYTFAPQQLMKVVDQVLGQHQSSEPTK